MNKDPKNSNKCPFCGRLTHKESKYCVFHASAEEKTEEEFKKALKEYVDKIKKENGDYNFKKFIFIGNIDFKEDLNVSVFKNVYFNGAAFKGDVHFYGTIFERKAFFSDAIFGGEAMFAGAIFKEYADFNNAAFEGESEFSSTIFKEYADFLKASFKGKNGFFGTIFEQHTCFNWAFFERLARFYHAAFKEDVHFYGTIFERRAFFNDVVFGGEAMFAGAIFKEDAYFNNAAFNGLAGFYMTIFKEDAEFKLKYLVKDLDFSEAKMLPGKKWSINVNNGKGIIIYQRTYLENIYLDIELVEDVFIDFTDALLRNTKIEKNKIESHILQEKRCEFPKAQKIYLLLKNNFHSIGQYKDEGWAFTKEKDMERKSKSFYSLLSKYKKYSLFKKILKQSNLLKRIIVRLKILSKWLFSRKAIEWFNLSFSDFIYQYGENPWRVIRFALIIIFLFAVILNFSGIVNSDSTNLIIEFIKKSQGDEYTIRYLGPVLGSFLNCLYFSVVTFTTLGYGDFQPAVGLSRFFVSLESIIGAITMALFVYTFARRTGGR